jgi:hypothetical protein
VVRVAPFLQKKTKRSIYSTAPAPPPPSPPIPSTPLPPGQQRGLDLQPFVSIRALSARTSSSSSATRSFRFRLRRTTLACHRHGPSPRSVSVRDARVLPHPCGHHALTCARARPVRGEVPPGESPDPCPFRACGMS